MSNKITGTFSISQIMDKTYYSKYNTRFEYRKRDVIKKVLVIKQTTLHPDRPTEPTITYIFKTYSYPQYYPYTRYTKYSKQRKFRHEYDNILSIEADENGKFSKDSVNWKYRLGSQKKWNNKPPQSQIKQIYRETMKKWTYDYNIACNKIKARNINSTLKKTLLQKEKDNLKKKIKVHRYQAKYLDVGDFNSRVLGLNGDFVRRVAPVYQHYGHLYGRNVENVIDADYEHPFAPKHFINLVDTLVKLGILI